MYSRHVRRLAEKSRTSLWWGSSEISGDGAVEGGEIGGVAEVGEGPDFHVNNLAGTLHGAPGGDSDAVAGGAAICVEDFGEEYEVGRGGLVLDGHEDDARGGAGSLADEDEAGDGDLFSVRAGDGVAEVEIRDDAEGGEMAALEGERVALEREADGVVIVAEGSRGGDGGERWDGLVVAGCVLMVEQGEVFIAHAADVPEGVLAGEVHGAEGVGRGETAESADGDAAGAPETLDGLGGAVEFSGGDEEIGVGLAEAVDEAEAEAEGGTRVAKWRSGTVAE